MGELALPYVLPRIQNRDLQFSKYANLLRALLGRRRRDVRIGSAPVALMVDATTTCQLHCPHCATGIGAIRRARRIMQPPVHDRLMEKVGSSCFIIWYFSNGEPLLNKHLPRLVADSRCRGIFSVISTNLSMRLSERAITDLLACGLGLIIVALDGATAETYRKYRRGGDFALVTDNLQRLVARKAQMGLEYPLIEWRFLLFQHNEHEEGRVRELAAEWGVDLLEFWPGDAPANASQPNRGIFASTAPLRGPALSGPAVWRLAIAQVRERRLARLVPGILVGGEMDPAAVTPRCDWLYYGGMVYPDGEIGPCDLLADEATDFVADLEEATCRNGVFNSPRYIASRRMFDTRALAGTACDHCPNPQVRIMQFRMAVRGLLRNAPDWVVKILLGDPDAFFFDDDRVLVPEVAAVFASKGLLRLDADPDAVRRLTTWKDDDGQVLRTLLLA